MLALKTRLQENHQSIKDHSFFRISDAEIEKMKKDAKEHEADDKKKKEMIDLKNQADGMIFQGERQLKEFEAKLDDATKSKIQAAIDRLKEAVKTDNAAALQYCNR